MPDGADDLSRSRRSLSSFDIVSVALALELALSLDMPLGAVLVPPLTPPALPGTVGLVSGTLLGVPGEPGLPGAGPCALRTGSPVDFEVVVSASGLHAESDSASAAAAGNRITLR
jgi:hypothetical protein